MAISMEKLLIGIVEYYNVVIGSRDFIEDIQEYHKIVQISDT
jgi:adenosine/AMP kinase